MGRRFHERENRRVAWKEPIHLYPIEDAGSTREEGENRGELESSHDR